ncbi:4284_t:CDS:2 [Ambispora gerdemannii]|uniref:4284_t:CDS:1 n=1 Tax=Ambispora gerdemannii TaxID=144530 RepID=A0A9N8VAB1_9GLOM|nr:4284_t:CDS:2 [Ambispora gerdemannii]
MRVDENLVFLAKKFMENYAMRNYFAEHFHKKRIVNNYYKYALKEGEKEQQQEAKCGELADRRDRRH